MNMKAGRLIQYSLWQGAYSQPMKYSRNHEWRVLSDWNSSSHTYLPYKPRIIISQYYSWSVTTVEFTENERNIYLTSGHTSNCLINYQGIIVFFLICTNIWLPRIRLETRVKNYTLQLYHICYIEVYFF